jgi:hypothetical protein
MSSFEQDANHFSNKFDRFAGRLSEIDAYFSGKARPFRAGSFKKNLD